MCSPFIHIVFLIKLESSKKDFVVSIKQRTKDRIKLLIQN